MYILGHLRPLWTFTSVEASAVIRGHLRSFETIEVSLRPLRSCKAIIEVKMHLKSSLQVGLIKSNHPNIQAYFLSQNGTLEYFGNSQFCRPKVILEKSPLFYEIHLGF